VVIANCVFMSLAINRTMDTLDFDEGHFVYVDWCFTLFYLLEFVAKLSVHGLWLFRSEDVFWHLLDLFIVVSSIYDAVCEFLDMFGGGVSTTTKLGLLNLRILRIVKVIRVLKLLRIFSEFCLLMNSVIDSFLHLFWSLILLAFTIYVFAMLMVQNIADFLHKNQGHVEPDVAMTIADNFGSMQLAMLSLLKVVSFGELWTVYLQVLPPFSTFLLIFYVILMQFQISNVLTAIFAQNTARVHKPDALTQASMDRAKLEKEADELRQLIKQADEDHDGIVSARDLLEAFEDNEDLTIQLRSIGFDIDDVYRFFDLIVDHSPNGQKGERVEVDTFVDAVMRMKGAAKVVTQETLLMETRAFRHSQAVHNLSMKSWQAEMNRRLEAGGWR